MTSFQISIAQVSAHLEPDERLDWLHATLASSAPADLVLLPELFACGYNIANKIRARAESATGASFKAIATLAREFDVALHYGFAEHSEGHIYNSSLCVGPDGTVLNHHRKLAIPPGFEREHFTPGKGVSVFSYRGLKLATLICYDAEFPETVREVARLGADLVLVPTALGDQWDWVSHTMIPTRAYENGVYLAYANSAGIENGLRFLGKSVIAGPDGREVARAGAESEVISARIELERVRKAQDRLPYLRDRQNLRL